MNQRVPPAANSKAFPRFVAALKRPEQASKNRWPRARGSALRLFGNKQNCKMQQDLGRGSTRSLLFLFSFIF